MRGLSRSVAAPAQAVTIRQAILDTGVSGRRPPDSALFRAAVTPRAGIAYR